MRKVITAIPPDVARPVIPAAEGTLAVRPLKAAARAEDAVMRGTFQNLPTLEQFTNCVGADTFVPWLRVCVDVARTVILALRTLPPLNAPIPVMFYALERTSAAVRPPSPC